MSEQPNSPSGANGPSEPDTGHDYDGIREHDNVLPNWWLATLILTMVFGYGYWMYFHVLKAGKLQQAEYQAEMDEAALAAKERAKQRGEVTADYLAQLSQSASIVASGAATFKQSCASCHGAKGEGLIGPNLTDAYWIHGGKATDLLKVVSAGIAAKGMPAWEPVLGADSVHRVVAYLMTVRGSNLPGKAPQGTNDAGEAAPTAP